MAPITRSSKSLPSTTFGPPFDDDDADIILRSSDHVDFYVYRVILSKTSPVFKSMFSLPQPDTSFSEKQLPIINLTEGSRTVAVLLSSIYPVVTSPAIKLSLGDMIDALVAAGKYDMDVISQRLVQKFAKSEVVRDSPVVAFCAAYSHKLGDAARVAAKASLKHRMNLDNIGDTLQHTNGPAFYQLYKFHRACSATAAEAVSGTRLTWITKSHEAWWGFAIKGCSSNYKCPQYRYVVTSGDWYAATPWHNFIIRARDVLLEHPCKEAVAGYSVLQPSVNEEACDSCRRTLIGLPEFIRLLGEEVERRVSKVRHFLAYFLDTSYAMAPTEGRSRFAILIFCGLSTYVHLYESSRSEVESCLDYIFRPECSPISSFPSPVTGSKPEEDQLITTWAEARVILSKASPVFRDMFTFPHPGPSSKHVVIDDDDHKDGLPLVRLPESSVTLSMLLYAIYPVSPSHAQPPYAAQGRGQDDGALDTLTDAWLAADKYEVSGLREALTARLQTHPLMARQPLRMFGVAYYLRSQTLLRTAAARTLPLAPLTLDALGRHVDLVPFIAVRHLVEYHRACGEAARDFALLKADEDGFAEVFLPALLVQVSTSASSGRGGTGGGRAARVCKDSRCQFGNLRVPWPKLETLEWWRKYMEALSEKLSERPSLSPTTAMGACTNEWESLASKLCARCRGSAASALVLAHTYLAEVLKVEIEEEVRIGDTFLAVKGRSPD
ncbi:hypothetical protein BJY52DRAFT_1223579 [Lactarius psammicola]|nr:hypothetical protein BJY52DRAFT_1223579 [Lactarius psammicola]